MRKVAKIEINLNSKKQTIEVPMQSDFFHLQFKDGKAFVWMLAPEKGKATEERKVLVLEEGDSIENSFNGFHIGTIDHLSGGNRPLHIFVEEFENNCSTL